MGKFVIKKIERNLNSQDFKSIGFSEIYTEAELLKANFIKLKIFDLTLIQANILKQTALSKGCDCVVNKGCLNSSVEKTDAILFGTKKQIINITKTLLMQQFSMPILAKEISEIIEEDEYKKPLIMGIINLTENSFSDGGNFLKFEDAIDRVKKLVNDGADIIDIGAESTKPFSDEVSSKIQLERIIPVLEEILSLNLGVKISVDTRSSNVAKEVLNLDKEIIINDVSGLCFDKDLVDVIIENNAKIIVCHSSSIPKDMQNKTEYNDVVDDIYKFFVNKTELLLKRGLAKDRIILDVGFGFGKTCEQNFELIRRFKAFSGLNIPLLVGVSRKSFIQKTVVGADFDEMTAVLNSHLFLKGASIFRVHDVKKTKDILSLVQNLR